MVFAYAAGHILPPGKLGFFIPFVFLWPLVGSPGYNNKRARLYSFHLMTFVQ